MTKKLSKRELTYFRKLLEQKRSIATGGLDNLNSNGSSVGNGGDSADQGTEASTQDFTLSLMAKEANIVQLIDDALERIEKGTYGICAKSGKPIGKARLEAIPWAHLSVECQREEEGGF